MFSAVWFGVVLWVLECWLFVFDGVGLVVGLWFCCGWCGCVL